MTPPAPPRFSTSTCCPRFSDSAGTTLRVTMSVPPPGAAGTTRRIGRAGYWASAGEMRGAARSPQTSSAMNLVTVDLALDDVAGSGAEVLEVESPRAVFVFRPARDKRSPFSEFVRPRHDAPLGGTGN